MDEVLSDIYAQCLARLDAGATVEDCLAAYPQQRVALEGPLRLAARLRALPGPAPLPSAARAAMATKVLAQVAAQRSATTGSVRSTRAQPISRAFDPVATLAGVLRALGYRGPLSPTWLRLASVAIGLILALILSAGALAAARAIIHAIAPPQPTAVPTSTGPTLVPAETFTLDGPIAQIATDGWVVNGMPVALDAQTTISGTPAVGAVAHVRGTLQDNGSLLARSITVDAVVIPTGPPTGAPTAAPVEAPSTSAPIAEAPTAVPELTVAPTTAPEPPPAPATSGDLFAQLRALLVAGVADGRAGEDGKELVKKFDEGYAAFASGDLQKTAEKLRELRQKVQEKTREGKMEANFSRQVLGLIDTIANSYSLNVASDEKGKDDKGKEDKREKDKGKHK
jgi:hypothetical protein